MPLTNKELQNISLGGQYKLHSPKSLTENVVNFNMTIITLMT